MICAAFCRRSSCLAAMPIFPRPEASSSALDFWQAISSRSWKNPRCVDLFPSTSPRMLAMRPQRSSKPWRYRKKQMIFWYTSTEIGRWLAAGSASSVASTLLAFPYSFITLLAAPGWNAAMASSTLSPSISAMLSGRTNACTSSGLTKSSNVQKRMVVSLLLLTRKNGRSGWTARPYTSALCSCEVDKHLDSTASQTRMVASQEPLNKIFGSSVCQRRPRT
mmetsp:Transcript_55494/g.132634  ORF Transcript_55494/g.132634 Transcript_55494/m.132634 type:complete len:221 (-) Transcript_55494:790-1452(-)